MKDLNGKTLKVGDRIAVAGIYARYYPKISVGKIVEIVADPVNQQSMKVKYASTAVWLGDDKPERILKLR